MRVDSQVAKPSIIVLWLRFRASCSNSTLRFSAARTPPYSSTTWTLPLRIALSIRAISRPANGPPAIHLAMEGQSCPGEEAAAMHTGQGNPFGFASRPNEGFQWFLTSLEMSNHR